MRSPSTAHDRLIRKLESIADLSPDDRKALQDLSFGTKLVLPNQSIVQEGDDPNQCCLLVEGLIHRYKLLPNGSRQILSFHLPGDILDLQNLYLTRSDHSIGVVVPSQVALVPHKTLKTLADDCPGIGVAFWRDTLIDAAILREWIVNVGARSAQPRIAHLICELFTRLKALWLSEEDGFTLQLTQAEIGEATGLSTVHVNRTLQDLRRSNLIASEGRFLRILNWAGLQREACFDPAYLHLKTLEAA